MEDRKRWVIAIKREHRHKANLDLRTTLSQTPGVEVVGATGTRAQFEATDEVAATVQETLKMCHVEAAAPRTTF